TTRPAQPWAWPWKPDETLLGARLAQGLVPTGTTPAEPQPLPDEAVSPREAQRSPRRREQLHLTVPAWRRPRWQRVQRRSLVAIVVVGRRRMRQGLPGSTEPALLALQAPEHDALREMSVEP